MRRLLTTCRAASLAAFVAICIGGGSVAKAEDTGVTYADLQAGYWLNYEQFKTLFVSWRHVHFPHENAMRRYEESWKSESPEQQAALRKASGRREEQNEFWSDREAFQVRTPAVLVPDRDVPGRTFSFPQHAARQENLMTDFQEIGVYNFNGNLADGVKFWNGVLQGLPQGAVLSRLHEGAPGRYLPPLAVHYPIAGFIQHPFDAFFTASYETARVVDRVQRDGHDAFVVEKVATVPDGRARLQAIVEAADEDVNKVTLQEVQRAWIDMRRGCLPLRIEKSSRLIYDGKTIDDMWGYGPNTVVETQQIESVNEGGFYPIKVRELSYGWDTREHATVSFTEMIGPGPRKRKAALEAEGQWLTEAIEAGRDMTGFFGFDFPDSTVYFDFRTSKVVGRTYDTAKVGLNGAVRSAREREGRSLIRSALIWTNLALVTILTVILLWRRYGAFSNSRP